MTRPDYKGVYLMALASNAMKEVNASTKENGFKKISNLWSKLGYRE